MRHPALAIFAGAMCLILFSVTALAEEHAAVPAADVKIHDTVVFKVLTAQGAKTAEARASLAGHALEEAIEEPDVTPNVVVRADKHVIMVGDDSVIELDAADASAAGDATLAVHSSRVLSRVRTALKAERQRSHIAQTVFSISLVVFFGLFALFAVRKLGELATRGRAHIEENPDRVPAVRMHSLEVIGAGPLRALLLAALLVGRVVLQVVVLYVWLVFSLSRFETTRPLVERMSGYVLTPLLSLTERMLSALPLGFMALVTGVVVYVLVRFIELFFANVRRGETDVPWLPADLVLPVSVLSRVAVVLLALVFAGPFVTGDPEGSLARAGVVVMLALSLATTPLLASVVVGVMQVFSRRVRVGHELEVAGRRGKVSAVGLFDIRLRDDSGFELRVPHLLSLLSPLRTRGLDARTRIVLAVSPSAPLSRVKALLEETASAHAERPEATLEHIDASGARFVVSVSARKPVSESDLRMALAEALAGAHIALGHDTHAAMLKDRLP